MGEIYPALSVSRALPPPIACGLYRIKVLTHYRFITLTLYQTKVHNYSLSCILSRNFHTCKNFPCLTHFTIYGKIFQSHIHSQTLVLFHNFTERLFTEHTFTVKNFLLNSGKIIFCRLSVCEYKIQYFPIPCTASISNKWYVRF